MPLQTTKTNPLLTFNTPNLTQPNPQHTTQPLRHIDLGRAAFKHLAPESLGVIGLKWRLVDCSKLGSTGSTTPAPSSSWQGDAQPQQPQKQQQQAPQQPQEQQQSGSWQQPQQQEASSNWASYAQQKYGGGNDYQGYANSWRGVLGRLWGA